ncbi:hypothetical protein FRC04_011180 [Tulasnella sp. 424]|nr:hypothetical protein FRC04_011180 [Tulasnella sp. 424]
MDELGLSLDTTVKRKYLQYNKQIIKENSNLRVQVEELKSQISQLYVENLALGRSNIALEKQLKREKARRKSGGDPKTINDTDKLAVEMIKQLQTLRQSFAQMTATTNPAPQKDSPNEPIVRSRPSVSNRINLISRAPDFENIEEGEEADDDEDERCLEPSLVPLPDDDDDLSPRTSLSPSTSPSPEVQAEPQPNVTKRKPTRRQSGLLGPSRARISLSPAADDEEEVVGMLADREEEETTSVVPATLKSRKRTKHAADGNLRSGLSDVTNSPPRRENIQKGITSVLAEAEDDSKATMKVTQPPVQPVARPKPKSAGATPSSKPFTPDPSPAPSLPTSMVSADSHGDGAEEAAGSARPTRARKSVNYAEPKLNTKMRKPDEAAPVPYAYPSLPSAGGIAAKPTKPVSQPDSSIATTSTMPAPVDRPIKPLPTSLAKASTTLPQQKPTNETKPVVDDPVPRSQPRPKVRADPNGHIPRPPSISPVPKSDLSSDEEESEPEPTEEEEESDATPKKKSPKRPASKVVDEFKCASLSATVPVTKPTRIAAPVATLSTHERPSATSSLHRPASQQTSTVGFQRTNPASNATITLTGDATSRKRKTAPIKYQYFDLDSDEDEGVLEEDSEYVPPERVKLPSSKKSSVQATSGTARRHSSAS